ncbi:MAG TPA: DUF1549 domain-containing protein [Planctomycetaceae bacterium]|nr:DUF1549 domain-containing protein [Planctomycetaceae bacterium]
MMELRASGLTVAVLLASLFCAVETRAESLHEQIDRLIAAGTSNYSQIAAPLADDAEFLRRITLDLTGTVPTIAQTRAFLADPAPDKRQRTIDVLLASPEYARHMEQTFDVILMRRLPAKHVKAEEWQAYLLASFAANKPWHEIVRTMMTTDGGDPATRGAARFLLDRDADVNTITRDVSRLFLGANLECAQCHDHPLVEDFHQEHYYGLAAFFNRSFVFTEKDKPTVLAEKGDGEVKFESVFEIRDKKSPGPKTTGPKVFSSATISDPTFAKPEEAYVVAPADKVRPIPKFSRRAKFAEFVVSPENRRFCRSTVNRVWALLLGRGIVHPVDYDHTGNPPSHPALLALLTEEFANQNMDLKWLIREICLSQTYQRSSKRTAEGPAPADDRFAVAIMKPLSPTQMAAAVLQATGETDVQRAALGDKLNEEALHKQLIGYQQRYVQLFGGLAGKPTERFESTTDQVLYLMNDPQLLNLTMPHGNNLADRLLKLPADQMPALADELYVSVFNRPPTPEDVQDVQQYLEGQTDRPAAMSQLIWSLVTSSEFRFNH